MTIELGEHPVGPPQTPSVPNNNVLTNPGFETGALPPWINNGNWSVTGSDPHTGAFHAENLGNQLAEAETGRYYIAAFIQRGMELASCLGRFIAFR